MFDGNTVRDPRKLSLKELIEICGQAYKEYTGQKNVSRTSVINQKRSA